MSRRKPNNAVPERPAQRAAPEGLHPLFPLSELKEVVRELDNWEEDNELFQAGLVVLAPLSIGTIEPKALSPIEAEPCESHDPATVSVGASSDPEPRIWSVPFFSLTHANSG
jgi:hypothetical protein